MTRDGARFEDWGRPAAASGLRGGGKAHAHRGRLSGRCPNSASNLGDRAPCNFNLPRRCDPDALDELLGELASIGDRQASPHAAVLRELGERGAARGAGCCGGVVTAASALAMLSSRATISDSAAASASRQRASVLLEQGIRSLYFVRSFRLAHCALPGLMPFILGRPRKDAREVNGDTPSAPARARRLPVKK